MAFLYITCKDKEEAKKISKHLLEKRLIACSNIFPIESMYWWDNQIMDEKEIAVIAKTKKEKFLEIQNEVKNMHTYDVPCICLIDAETSEDYRKWIDKEIQ